MILVFKRPLGVIIFGLILIYTSLDLLRYMPSYEFYSKVNHEWPDFILRIRFFGSYLFRFAGLVLGVGVLCLNEFSRKFLIGLSWYSLFTLPLRHTYQAHLFFCEPIYIHHGSSFSLSTFTWISVVIRLIIDGVFSLWAIHYFSRPYVIKVFLDFCKKSKNSS